MKYLILFVFFFLLTGKIYTQENTYEKYTAYVLMPSISESCKNIVFSDSMYRTWNNASVEYMKYAILKDSTECFEGLMHQFIKGENTRLQFCKTLNDDSLIAREDFIKGFFIVEEVVPTTAISALNYFVTDRGGFFEIKSYKLFCRDEFGREVFVWRLMETKMISKRKFLIFFDKIKKCKKKEPIYSPMDFRVTKFTDEQIESYVYSCNGCYNIIRLFYDLIG